MKKVILISDLPIVKHIFRLIAKKMGFDLIIKADFEGDLGCDILIIEENFINDRFNFLKRHTKRLGAISTTQLGFNKAKDFFVQKPFLPSELESALQNVFNEIDAIVEYKPQSSKESIPFFASKSNIDTSFTTPIHNYLESLADDIAEEINDKNDDSVVNSKTVTTSSGILDKIELTKIKDILESSEKNINDDLESIIDEELNTANDWCELAEIIDKTIDELEQKAIKNKPLKILLGDINLEELKPLLFRLDKNTLEQLSNGTNIEIHLKLGAKNDPRT